VCPQEIRLNLTAGEEKKMKMHGTLGTILVATLLLAGCGGGGGGGNNNSAVSLKAIIAVPNVGTTTNFSFDIGAVDPVMGRYYFTDRNNKAVDVIDIKTNKFIKQITGGFAGCNAGAAPPGVPVPSCAGANNDLSGPDGLNIIQGPTFIYVGDTNSVKIIDTKTDTVVNTVPVGTGFRADEGCYDPDHQLFMINSPGESPPISTFININTQKTVATLVYPDSVGLEACVYDHATQTFLNNNDGSTPNPHGEVDVIPASFITAVGNPVVPAILTLPAPTPANGFKVFPLGNCDPTGLDLGPGTDMGVMCRQGTTGALLTFQILNRVTGAVLAVLNAGGGDEIAYDVATNRYYLSSSRYTASGLAATDGTCSAASPCLPYLIVVDAATRQIVANVQTGNNAHSVAVDPVTHQAYMPFSSPGAPAGCATCASYAAGGGVGVYTTQ
jgi:DNA-binding beta-propeller fold protein YncE